MTFHALLFDSGMGNIAQRTCPDAFQQEQPVGNRLNADQFEAANSFGKTIFGCAYSQSSATLILNRGNKPLSIGFSIEGIPGVTEKNAPIKNISEYFE